jgi:hypothetical protein
MPVGLPCGLGAQEPTPGGVQAARSGPAAPCADNPADDCSADLMAEAGQLALHPAVSPGWVLPCQPQHQRADLRLAAGRPGRLG